MTPDSMNQGADQSPARPVCRLRLFVAGRETNSLKAVEVITRLCSRHFPNQYELVTVDVNEDYQAAIKHQVMVVPTLIVESPEPQKTIVGSLSDESKVMSALGLPNSLGAV